MQSKNQVLLTRIFVECRFFHSLMISREKVSSKCLFDMPNVQRECGGGGFEAWKIAEKERRKEKRMG